MDQNTVVPFLAQLLVDVPVVQGHTPKTGTATGSDHEPGDNDVD